MRHLFGLLLLLVVLPSYSADSIAFPSGVALDKPQGFEKSNDFEGFKQEKTRSSILVMSFPLPEDPEERHKAIAQTKDTVLLKGLASQGIQVITSQKTEIAGDSQALFITGEQTVSNQELGRIIAVLHLEHQLVLIHGTFPQGNQNLYAAIEQSIKSATPIFDEEAANVLERPFEFNSVEGLHVIDIPQFSASMVQMSRDGQPSGPQNGDPFLQIVASLGPVNASDKTEYALHRFNQLEYMEDVKILETNKVNQAGLESVEIVAHVLDSETAVPLTVYQLIKFRIDGGYFLIIGMVAQAQAETYLKKFKQVALSVREANDVASADDHQIPNLIATLDANSLNMNSEDLTAYMQRKPDTSRYLPGGIARHSWDLSGASSNLKMHVWFNKNKQLNSYHIGPADQTIEGCYLFSSPNSTQALFIELHGRARFIKISTEQSSTSKSAISKSFSSAANEFHLNSSNFPVSLGDASFDWVNDKTLAIDGVELPKVETDLCTDLSQQVDSSTLFNRGR